jgi:hypothetical protein
VAFEVDVHSITVPTTTGNFSKTGLGFTPTGIIILASSRLNAAGASNSVDHEFSLGFFDGTRGVCITPWLETGVARSDVAVSQFDEAGGDVVWLQGLHDSGIDVQVSAVSLQSGGYTLNVDIADGSNYVLHVMAVGGDAAFECGSDTLNTGAGNQTISLVDTNLTPSLAFMCCASLTNIIDWQNTRGSHDIAWSIGVTDFTNDYSISGAGEDNNACQFDLESQAQAGGSTHAGANTDQAVVATRLQKLDRGECIIDHQVVLLFAS